MPDSKPQSLFPESLIDKTFSGRIKSVLFKLFCSYSSVTRLFDKREYFLVFFRPRKDEDLFPVVFRQFTGISVLDTFSTFSSLIGQANTYLYRWGQRLTAECDSDFYNVPFFKESALIAAFIQQDDYRVS